MPDDPERPTMGRYERLAELARGGWGTVYRAWDVELRRVVALKLLHRELPPTSLRRFFRGVQAQASIAHPGIVPVLAVGESEGRIFLLTELIEGGSLAQQLPQFLQDHCAGVWLLARVARAVHYVHQRGLLHRDLRPGHILLGPDGEPLLTDFSLVRLLESGSAAPPGTVIGTPLYMAPEQAAGEARRIGPATDVYALGVILYELLTGRPPFRGQNVVDTLRQVIERDPEPPRAVNPDVDADLEAVCLKCLRKDPGQRYPSAEALADDLERWLNGEAI